MGIGRQRWLLKISMEDLVDYAHDFDLFRAVHATRALVRCTAASAPRKWLGRRLLQMYATVMLRPLRRKYIYCHRKALSAPGRRPCRAWGSHPAAPPLMNPPVSTALEG